MWGGGAQQLQCKSESAQCSEKQQSPCEGDGGGGGLCHVMAQIILIYSLTGQLKMIAHHSHLSL